ncbi:hypothetical protein F4678DRAFT_458212 [Xylaria arbuscula]|nr:hypothetical protein F4678DRAFT_458212 [Xylaria arbuscula]
MDAVEKLFASLPDSDNGPLANDMTADVNYTNALKQFVKEPASQDPDYEYLLAHAKKYLKGNSAVGYVADFYFRQQLAQLAAQKLVIHKDKSHKARQLKYYRWLAQGMKAETYPFAKRQPQEHPSTTWIASLTRATTCACCGKNGANMRCPDCAFSDENHVLLKTSYCNSKCLKDHYEAHRSVCEGRRMIFRAASLLEYIFGVMQEKTYIYPLAALVKKNGILYPMDKDWDRACMTGRHVFIPLPKEVKILKDEMKVSKDKKKSSEDEGKSSKDEGKLSEDERRSLLQWGRGGDVTLCLSPLISHLFKPFCKKIEAAFVQLKNIVTPICQLSGGRALNVAFFTHTCLKLTLMSNEHYVIDLTASQFGWKEILAPWTVWADLRAFSTEIAAFKSVSKRGIETFHHNVFERQQQEIRKTLMEAVFKELEALPHAHPNLPPFDKLLRSSGEDYKRVEYDIKAMVRHKIDMLAKDEYKKDKYRLWLTRLDEIELAEDRVKYLKKIWFTGKEYDQLKASGADMRKLWWERFAPYYPAI